MTEREALKLALEALKRATNYDPVIARAITAIKEALAQPEQEPVGQLLENAFGRGQVMWFNKPKDESTLYTTPPQRKPLTAMEVYDVVHDADLDWHTGFALGEDENRFVVFARAIEAAHGIKGEA